MTEFSDIQPSRRPSMVRRLKRRAFRAIPLLVWALAIFGALQLSQVPAPVMPYRGVVPVSRAVVESPLPGHLHTLLVVEGEQVKQNQILARLDERALLLRIDKSRAELERLKSEMAGDVSERDQKSSELRSEQEADMRRFARDRESAHIDVLVAHAKLEEDRVRRQGYDLEFRRIEALEEKGLAAESEMTRLKTELDSLIVRIDQNEALLKLRQDRFEAANARHAEFSSVVDGAGRKASAVPADPFTWAITAQQAELDEIVLARSRLTLRAPIAGRIEGVLKRPGQSLAAGGILLTIVSLTTDQLIAYVPAADAREIVVGMEVEVERVRVPGQIVRSRVRAVGTAIDALPIRFLFDPKVPEFAQSVFLEPVSGMPVVPGEELRVRFVESPH